MTPISRSLSFALVTLVACSAMAPACAEIVIKGNIELPYPLVLGDADISDGKLDRLGNPPVLGSTMETGPQIAAGEAVGAELLPVNATLDEPVSDSSKFTAEFTGAAPNNLGAPQPGPEPYVMLLVGLGLIVLAITLHLKPMQQPRSGFKPSQGMPFV